MKLILVIILFSCYSFLRGQNISSLDSLLIELELELELECDSIIGIEIVGNLESKLIFHQQESNSSNKNSIQMPWLKVAKDNGAVFLSEGRPFEKTILELEYDTCIISAYSTDRRKAKYDFIGLKSS